MLSLIDTSLHVDESLFNEEEISYEKLQENYNLMYTKWIDLVAIGNTLKKDLQNALKQKEVLEQRNQDLIGQ